MRDIWQFILSLMRHWIPLLTGGIGMSVLGFIEHRTRDAVSWPSYISIALAFFIFSCYLAWRVEYLARIQLEERARPKLAIRFQNSGDRPETQDWDNKPNVIDARLFRVAVSNESTVPITGAQLILESVRSDPENFFLGHELRVMGQSELPARFNIAAGATQWIDLIEYVRQPSGVYYHVTYAALGVRHIPLGRHEFILRADGGGLPSRARVIVNCSSDKNEFGVTEFQILSNDI
jgi:hypothetical protein